jgi:N6-adenosine-specific RNA methylase IME4
MNRVIKLFMGAKGIEIELHKIETTKEEIIAIQKNMRALHQQMLQHNVTLIESLKRLTWNGPSNYNELIEEIMLYCEKLKLSDAERRDVFKSKILWEEREKEVNKGNE